MLEPNDPQFPIRDMGFAAPDAMHMAPDDRPIKQPTSNILMTLLAWCVIVLVAGAVFFATMFAGALLTDDTNPDDPIGFLLMKVQAKYGVGASSISPGNNGILFTQLQPALDMGSIKQRQAFVVFASEMMGSEEASTRLGYLFEDIAAASDIHGDAFEVTEAQATVNEALLALYPSVDFEDENYVEEQARVDAVAALTDDQRQALVDELGWFGELAMHPVGVDDLAARDALLSEASKVVITVVAFVILLCAIGFFGFAGLIMFLVFLITGRVQSGLKTGRVPHGIYAETFAVWLLIFMGGQILLGFVPASAQMISAVGLFFGSLLALVWPVLRGAQARDVCHDVGLSFGRNPVMEVLSGLACYAMALPILAVGLGIMLILVAIQAAFTPAGGEGDIFVPTGGPAHPIILEIANGSISARVLILLLAAVAAPVVEEIMFRGVLYRHLRDASRSFAVVGSFIVSGLLSSFVFAIVHPQGWIAVPVLMALAMAFCLAREWRDSLIAPMVVHGTSNGIVMTMMIFLVGA
ncbi:MAG: CPBP family intramembrane glutamic endopeptidase [Planctomycetota bacterium]